MNKSIVTVVIALTASALFAAEGVVTANLLNCRREPNLKSPVMVKLKKGDKVNVVAEKENGWFELALPEKAKVFVSEAYVSGGKAIADLKMYSGKGKTFPTWGSIKKGEAVKTGSERGYGWVNIEPPETLRIYVYNMYVELKEALPEKPAEAAKPAENKPAEAKTDAAAKPAPETKPEVKPAKPAPETKPEAKPAEKSEAKPAPAAAKPTAKPAEKTAAKPAAAKPAEKTAEKPAAKPAPAKKAEPIKPDKVLTSLGVVPTDKSVSATVKGMVVEVPDSKSKATNFVLTDDKGQLVAWLYDQTGKAQLKKFVEKQVTIQGDKFKINTWKTPIVVVRSVK